MCIPILLVADMAGRWETETVKDKHLIEKREQQVYKCQISVRAHGIPLYAYKYLRHVPYFSQRALRVVCNDAVYVHRTTQGMTP